MLDSRNFTRLWARPNLPSRNLKSNELNRHIDKHTWKSVCVLLDVCAGYVEVMRKESEASCVHDEYLTLFDWMNEWVKEWVSEGMSE